MTLVSRWRSGDHTEIYLARETSRRPLRLGEFMGEGNSAEVFAIAEEGWNELVVAKIYLPGKKPDHLHSIIEEARQRDLAGLGGRGHDADGGRYSPLAIPKGILYPSAVSSEPCGLLVTKIDSTRFISLDTFFQTPLKNDLTVTSFAAECLAEIVAWLHDNGYVVGDFSGTNIRVDSTGHVCLLDVDSFGIVGNGILRPSADSSRHFLAPESSATGQTDQESDRFVLTMLVCQLLLGISPFAGAEKGNRNSSIQDNINHGKSWLFSPGDVVLPVRFQAHPGLAALPASTGRLVRRGLAEPDQRPAAAEWVVELRAIQSALEKCTCGGMRFSGAACPACKDGYKQLSEKQALPAWGYQEQRPERRTAQPGTARTLPQPRVDSRPRRTIPAAPQRRPRKANRQLILAIVVIFILAAFLAWSLLS